MILIMLMNGNGKLVSRGGWYSGLCLAFKLLDYPKEAFHIFLHGFPRVEISLLHFFEVTASFGY